MKRIKSRRQLAAGVIALVLALLCFVVMGLRGFQPRYLAAGLLALVWSSVSLSLAFSQRGLAEELAAQADERGRRLALQFNGVGLRLVGHTVGRQLDRREAPLVVGRGCHVGEAQVALREAGILARRVCGLGRRHGDV